MLRVCTACHQSVARQDCHRNRYGEYICRLCQASGVKFTWRWRIRRRARRTVKLFLVSMLMGLLVVAIGWTFYALFDVGATVLAPGTGGGN